MIKKLDFGVFFTCFTEFNAVEHSLDKLFSIYPEIPVFLISDGGDDYSKLENKFKGLKTSLEHDSRGGIPKINDSIYLNPENQKYMIDSIFTFLERINKSIDYCKKPYILIMEPDLLVRGELNIEEDAHISGSKVNLYHWASERINKILSGIEGSIPVSHYGFLAILKCESFKKVYDFFKKNPEYIKEFCQIDSQFSNYDIFLVVLFAAMGYELVENDEIVECLRDPMWRLSGHPLVHQFREHYPANNYTGRHSNG